MSSSYLPRGYITIPSAIDRLTARRHPDLPCFHSCNQEIADLKQLKLLSRRRPGPHSAIGQLRDQEDVRPKFTAAHARRLSELAELVDQIESLRIAAAKEFRAALAEGELFAMLLTADGHERRIDKSRWRASDGWDCMWKDRISPEFTNDLFPNLVIVDSLSKYGVALISEPLFDKWMNTGSCVIEPVEDRGTRSDCRPAPTAALRKWYQARVQGWPADRKSPSEAQDWEDAKMAFPERKVTRDSIRLLRRELAPPAWTAHGRRKLARE